MSAFGGAGTKGNYAPKKDTKAPLRSALKKPQGSSPKIPGLTARPITGRQPSSKLRSSSRIPGLTRNALNPRGAPSKPSEDYYDEDYDYNPSTATGPSLPAIAEAAPMNIPQQLGSIRSNFTRLLEKKIPQTPQPQEETAQESKQSVAAQLKKLLGKVYERPEDKYLVLKKRDDLLSKARVQNFNIKTKNVITGTLKELCPEKERYSRLMQGTENYYECDAGVFNPDKAVKEYSRSAADQELPLPHEMRPIETLELTMDFLIQEVADDVCSNSSELLRWFDFLWNRTRAIRKDITQQQLVSERVVKLIEKCARFHIFAGYRLAPLSPQFDQRLNIENLNKCLLSLRHCYDDLARKNIICENEAEFRSYDILLNLCDSNVFNQSIQYRDEIQNDKAVKNALEIALAYHTDNISRFFKLVDAKDTSFLQACLAYNHFQTFRSELLLQASVAFGTDVILSYLTPYFAFDNDKDCMDFLTFHGCTIKESKAERTLVSLVGAKKKSELKDAPDPIVSRKLRTSISEIIYKGIPPRVKPPKAVNSFDAQDRYINDPILNEFLKELGEELEAPDDREKKNVAFSFAPSNSEKLFAGVNNLVNKNLFQPGYSKDPNEAVPVTRFVPPTGPPKPFGFPTTTTAPALFQFGSASSEAPKATLAPPSFLTVPNASLPIKPPTPPGSLQPPKLPEFTAPLPIEPPKPPPGPTKEEIEAEKRRVAEEERKKKEAEKAKINLLAENVAKSVADEMFNRTVKTMVLKSVGIAQKKLKEIKKENKHLVKVSTRSMYHDLIRDAIKPLAEEAYDEQQSQFIRLEEIKATLHQLRLNARCTRYIAIWKWATRIKKERRAIQNFSKTLENRNNDPIFGMSRSLKRTFGTPITEADVKRLNDIRIHRLQAKYLQLWKTGIATRKAKKAEAKIKISPRTYHNGTPSLFLNRQEQKRLLYEGNMFPNRKRRSDTSVLEPSEKRFFTSTPFRPGLSQENFTSLTTISPVISSNSVLFNRVINDTM